MLLVVGNNFDNFIHSFCVEGVLLINKKKKSCVSHAGKSIGCADCRVLLIKIKVGMRLPLASSTIF